MSTSQKKHQPLFLFSLFSFRFWGKKGEGKGGTYAQPDIQHSSEPGGGGLIGIWIPLIDLIAGRIGILGIGGVGVEGGVSIGLGIIGTMFEGSDTGAGEGGEGIGEGGSIEGIDVVVVVVSSNSSVVVFIFIGILKFDLWDNFGIDFIHWPDLFNTNLLISLGKWREEK